ncbi:MAG: tetratricopeptide repeat protein [Gammaproteobacteria bacterium]|nr:tetratricopeptide repeat protein [Gammaproteobacteria bacterium]
MSDALRQSVATIDAAITAFQSGNAQHAFQICQDILARTPHDLNALNFSGVICDATGNKSQAANFFQQAVALNPDNSQLLTNLGSTLIDLNQLSEARTYLEKAIQQNNSYAEAYYNLGNLCYLEKNIEQAITNYEKSSALNPTHLSTLNNLARCYQQSGNSEAAKNTYSRLLKLKPDFVEALIGLGSIYYFAQEKEQALAYYQKALHFNPQHESANYMVGQLLLESEDRLEESLPFLEKAYQLVPDDINVCNALGQANLMLGNTDNAEQLLKKSLQIKPQQLNTLNMLAQVYHERGITDTAKDYYRQALVLDPNNSHVLNNLGLLQRECGEYEESEISFKAAIESEKYLPLEQRATAINNLSLTELLVGKFAAGWDHYRYRASVQNTPHVSLCPDRNTVDITHKKILWVKDQGIGDELFFLRFIPALKAFHCNNTYRCSYKFRPLVEKMAIIDRIYDNDDIREQFDYQFSIADLPYLLNHQNAAEIPPPIPMQADAALKEKIQNVLQEFGPPPYIAISWRAGNPSNNRHIGSYYKYIEPQHLANVLQDMPGTLISLQINPQKAELDTLSQQLNRPVLDVSPYHDQLENMLALLDLVDIYLTVSNTYVHFRESLGKKSHVFINSSPEWRWMTSGKHSDWFPNSIAYRQDSNGSWENAVTDCKKDLRES